MRLYRPYEVSSAPEAPGLYAWYALPRIGAADIQTPGMLSRIFTRHLERLAPSSLDVKISAPFGATWTGTLPCRRDEVDLSSLDRLDQEGRQLFADIFSDAAVLCASPLYVGITVDQTLRDRLARHVANLRADVDEGDRSNFGMRARAAGLGEDQLVAVALPVDDEHRVAQRATVITSLEEILNRATNPLLGRR